MLKIKKGFTLIELLVVITIIAMLIALSAFSLQGARESARDAQRKANLQAIAGAIEIYRSDCNTYPVNASGSDFSAKFGSSLLGGGCTPANTNTYLQEVPVDPITGHNYYYVSDGNTFTLCAGLETETTLDATYCTGADCGTGVTCSYHVINP